MTAVNVAGMGLDDLLAREWIAVNHLGGFASSTVAGLNTRKYHGLLVAAMAPPVRRMVILSRVEETVRRAEQSWQLANSEYPEAIHPQGFTLLRAFSHDPFPRWAYQGEGWTIEKELRLIHGTNTVWLRYSLLASAVPIELELRPLFALRGIHELVFQWNGALEPQVRPGPGSGILHRIPPTGRTPEAFFAHDGEWETDGHWYLNTIYRRERERGYAGLEDLWMPGVVRYSLNPGQSVSFVCSTEPIDFAIATAHEQAPGGTPVSSVPAVLIDPAQPDASLERLTRAAGQFLVDLSRDSVVITSLPWASPSLRDGLIAFAGLFLVPRRFKEAKRFLTSVAAKLNGGLIPTELPEDGTAARYTGADTSLWFVHAVDRYIRYSGDSAVLSDGLFDVCAKIVERYRNGTAGLGIGCDADGLVFSRVPGAATSWMDVKVGDWVITPRQGRPVELNALWYSSLRIVGPWCDEFDQSSRADELADLAARVKSSFNRSFWNEAADCCYDVVMDHGATDVAIRPNQLLSVSLPHPVLNGDRGERLLKTIESRLLTPVGLRTLAADDPAYQGRYFGDVVCRDRSYHQGSVFPWLLGHFVSAMLRTRGRSTFTRAIAHDCLLGCLQHIAQDGLGQLCELFDGDAPHRPGGAIASARSVGEIFRCYVEDVLNLSPETLPTDPKLTQLRPWQARNSA